MIITAKITKAEKHPNAQKLKVCLVTDGQETWSVVCGATNVKEGMISVLAKPGSTMPSGLEIKISNLRGVDSHGMLCSANDLSIAQENGIIDLPPDTKLGQNYLDLAKELLSSTPWYLYDEKESLWWDETLKRFFRVKGKQSQAPSPTSSLSSKTYYTSGKYLYRQF